jgi:chemotaxis signal transduction protein
VRLAGVVCFRTAAGVWAVDVASARRVLPASALVALPDPLPGVVGLLEEPGSAPLPVIALGDDAPDSAHVLELEAGGRRFGLLVTEVTEVLRDERAQIGPPPGGQDEETVCGVVALRDGTALLLDPEALARRLRRPAAELRG